MRLRRSRSDAVQRLFALLAVLVTIALLVPAVGLAKPKPPVTIQLLNASDWHGNVDPVGGFGGAWNLSARWQDDRLAYPSLTLAGGDDFGATPALSNFFEEVPAVLAQRLMGVQVGTFGNHNFDRGIGHLQQMIDLARAKGKNGPVGTPFPYVSANLKLHGELRHVKPMEIFKVGGLKVAVIGILNEEAPNLVFPGSFGKIEITDGVKAANKYAKRASKKADVVVVVTHKGVRGFNAGSPFGELIDFASAVDSRYIDVIIGDHTDVQYSGTINGMLVHENRSFGVTYTKTLLTVQTGGGHKKSVVTSKSVDPVSPGPAGALSSGNTACGALTYCDQAVVDMLVPYRQQLAALLDGKIGTTATPFDNGGVPVLQRSGETELGDLIADGMRWRYSTQLAFMNGGGIRQQFPTCVYNPTDTSLKRSNWNGAHTALSPCAGYAAGGPYDIVLGDVFTVLPFGNIVTTKTVTGATIWSAMENGVSRIDASGNGADGRFPQISGFKFKFRYDIPTGCTGSGAPGVWTACAINRVQSVTLDDGTPIPNDSSMTYTLALPNFHNLGGDNYFMFNDSTGTTQELDANVITLYMDHLGGALDPASFPLNRITECNGACP